MRPESKPVEEPEARQSGACLRSNSKGRVARTSPKSDRSSVNAFPHWLFECTKCLMATSSLVPLRAEGSEGFGGVRRGLEGSEDKSDGRVSSQTRELGSMVVKSGLKRTLLSRS